MPPIRSLVATAQLRTDQFESGARRVQGSLKDMRTVSDQVSAAFGQMGQRLLGMAAGVASLSAVSSGLQKIVADGLKMEKVTIALTSIAGSSAAAARDLQFLRDTSNRTGVAFDALAKGFVTISAAAKGTGSAGEGTRKLLEAFATTAARLALSGEDVQGMLTAVSQAFSKGKLTTEEFLQVSERLPGSMGIFSRALGVTTAEFSKMLESGALAGTTLDEVWSRVSRQMQAEAGAVSTTTQNTSLEFTRLDNVLNDLSTSTAKGFLPALADAAKALAEVLTQGKETATMLGSVLDPVVRYTTAAILGLGSGFSTTGKMIAAVAVLATEGLEAWKMALDDIKQSAAATDAVIQKLVHPPTSTTPAAGPAAALPVQPKLSVDTTKAMADALAAVAKDAARARTEFLASGDPLERMKNELKEIENGLSAIGKKFASDSGVLEIPAGPAQKTFLELTRRATELHKSIEASVEGTKAQRDATREAAAEAKRAAREAEQEAERLERVEEQRRDSIGRVLIDLSEERQQLTMSADAWQLYQLGVLGASAEALKAADALQKRIALLKDDREAIDDLAEAERALFQGDTGSQQWLDDQAQALQDFHKLRQTMGREQAQVAEEAARQNERLGRTALDMADALGDALKKGGDAWIQFAETVSRMLLKMAMESSGAEEKLGAALKTGLGLVLKLFSASAGTTDPSVTGDITGADMSAFAKREGGGPVAAGKAYIVGESGQELLIPRMPGTVVSNEAVHNAYTQGGAMMANAHSNTYSTSRGSSSSSVVQHQGAPVIHVHINAMDAGSVIRSRAEISRAIGQAVQASTRHS